MTLNVVEVKMLEALRVALSILQRRSLYKSEYALLLKTVRDGVMAGDNKERGCPSGTHDNNECLCTPEKQGHSINYIKNYEKLRWRPRK